MTAYPHLDPAVQGHRTRKPPRSCERPVGRPLQPGGESGREREEKAEEE